MTKPTTITIPPDTLSASQIAAVVSDVLDSLPYYRSDERVKVKGPPKFVREVEALLECKG